MEECNAFKINSDNDKDNRVKILSAVKVGMDSLFIKKNTIILCLQNSIIFFLNFIPEIHWNRKRFFYNYDIER